MYEEKNQNTYKSYYEGRSTANILVYIFIRFLSPAVCVYVWERAYVLFKIAFNFLKTIRVIPVYCFITLFFTNILQKYFLFNFYLILWPCRSLPCEFTRGGQTLFLKVQVVNMLGFVGHVVCVTSTQLCCCNERAAIDNT